MADMAYELHIARTRDWFDAASAPITREDVEYLIQTDRELGWSTSDYLDTTEGGNVTRYYMIKWRGTPCFLWCGSEITCSSPNKLQLVKLAEIAERMNAFLIGDDGERYALGRDLFGRRRVKFVNK